MAKFANEYATTLDGAINNSQTTFDVDSVTGVPATPFVIRVGNEYMNVTNVTSNTFTVTRAIESSSAASHADAAAVTNVLTAGVLNNFATGNQAVGTGDSPEFHQVTTDEVSPEDTEGFLKLYGGTIAGGSADGACIDMRAVDNVAPGVLAIFAANSVGSIDLYTGGVQRMSIDYSGVTTINSLAYSAAVSADWDDNPPATVAEALDRIAALLGPIT